MAVIRRPAKMIESGVQPQRSVGEVLLEEAGRAGIGLVGGLAQAALQPVVTSLGPEGSIGRDFVSPEIREMKRREAESMAAARVAPYYAQQQATQRTGMSEAAKTQRTGMGLEGAMEQKKLGEGSDILQLAMQLQGKKDFLQLEYSLKEKLRRAATRVPKRNVYGMTPNDFKFYESLMEKALTQGKNPDKSEVVDNQIAAGLTALASRYPLFKAYLTQAGLDDTGDAGYTPSPTKQKEAEIAAASRETVAGIGAKADVDVAEIKTEGQKAVQDMKNTGAVDVASLNNASREDVAKIQSAAKKYAADKAKEAKRYADDTRKIIAKTQFNSNAAKVAAEQKATSLRLAATRYQATAKAFANARSRTAQQALLLEMQQAKTQLDVARQNLGGATSVPKDGAPAKEFYGTGAVSIEEMRNMPDPPVR